MVLVKEEAPVGALGIDTIAVLRRSDADALYGYGFKFAIRYLGSLTTSEVADILDAGLALMPVGYSRGVGWLPTGPEGISDGVRAVKEAQELGLPDGVTVWCDLEGMGGTAADTIAYTEAWGEELMAAGYIPGVYVGAGIPLSGMQLYRLNNVHAYWHACSEVPEVDVCGYQMYQLWPPDQQICGIEVDIDVIQSDRKGRYPVWTKTAP